MANKIWNNKREWLKTIHKQNNVSEIEEINEVDEVEEIDEVDEVDEVEEIDNSNNKGKLNGRKRKQARS